MKIQISQDAVKWYKQELNLKNGDYVRFFARYGGCSTVQSGFSLGVSNEEPTDIGAKVLADGITFYIEEKDLWYFDEHDLIIDYQAKQEEPLIQYEKQKHT